MRLLTAMDEELGRGSDGVPTPDEVRDVPRETVHVHSAAAVPVQSESQTNTASAGAIGAGEVLRPVNGTFADHSGDSPAWTPIAEEAFNAARLLQPHETTTRPNR